jgi:hypothetical protein
MLSFLHSRVVPIFLLCAILTFYVGCGGSSSDRIPIQNPADFAISLSGGTITAQAGGAAESFTISVSGVNGFTGPVSVTVTGLPTGSTTDPAGTIVIGAGQTQTVSLSIPTGTVAGAFPVTVQGTSGALQHAATLTLHVTAAVDFTLEVTPADISSRIGGTSTSFEISATAQNGFHGDVLVGLSGLPAGATSLPVAPFQLSVGTTQAVTIAVPSTSAAGRFRLHITGSSGALTRTADVMLLVNPNIRTYETADMLYLESSTGTETAKIGLLKAWGGSIVEASLNDVDYVNNDDPGRQIQTSLWDGNSSYGGVWGWNPIEAGDSSFHGSPLLAGQMTSDSLYTKTQPIQWAPENFGGTGNAVPGDAYIEKWISVVPGYSRVFKVHYKVTHFGSDTHADAMQELPVMYVNPNVQNFLYYAGNDPWTSGALTPHTMGGCCPQLYTPEQWGAYVDGNSVGIALYTPMQFPNSKGFNAGSTLQFTPLCPYSWDPGSVLEFDTYILMGPVDESRAAIYALHAEQTDGSPLPPLAFFDLPAKDSTISGTAKVEGWAWGLSPITHVDVFVDGTLIGNATYGLQRDVTSVFPGAPAEVGYEYWLDTTKLSNGPHTLLVKIVDQAGHVATMPTRAVTVSN